MTTQRIQFPSEVKASFGFSTDAPVFLSASITSTHADFDPDTGEITNATASHPEEAPLEAVIDLVAADHLHAKDVRYNAIVRELHDLQAEHSNLHLELERAISEIDEMAGNLSVTSQLLATTRTERDNARTNLEEALNTVDRLTADVTATHAELDIARDAITKAKATYAALKTTTDSIISKLTADVALKTSALAAAVSSLETVRTELIAKTARLKQLNIAHEHALTELEDAREKLKNTTDDLTEARTQLDSTRATLIQTEHDLASTKKEVDQLGVDLGNARNALDDANSNLATAQQKLEKQAGVIAEDEKKIKTITFNLGKAKKEHTRYTNSHHHTDKEYKALKQSTGDTGFKLDFNPKFLIPLAAIGVVLAIIAANSGFSLKKFIESPQHSLGFIRSDHSLDFLKDTR